MINDTIKNKYIVCKSPEHGKKIIEFFVKNGAVNPFAWEGRAYGCAYLVNSKGIIVYYLGNTPLNYTEMQLPEEFTPKRGDVVEVSFSPDKSKFYISPSKEMITAFIEETGEWMQFHRADTIKITKAEAEKMLGKIIEG